MPNHLERTRQRNKDIFELDIPTFKAISIPQSPKEEPREVQGMLERKKENYYDGVHKAPRTTYTYWIADDDKWGMNDRYTLVDPFTIELVEHTDAEEDQELQGEGQTIPLLQ